MEPLFLRQILKYMKRFLVLMFTAALPLFTLAQLGKEAKDTSWKTEFRGSNPRINDLVHTKLDVKFDYDKAYMYGKEWVTLKPHFYDTDSVWLDAKGMDISNLSLMKGTSKTPLKYSYDGKQIRVTLDKTYKGGENFTLYIELSLIHI